ncbi:MAG: SH3 domain-containing protein [Eubacterium sp.]|nr:SH3 domain-containing protein [Eubacterium sp.]
MIKRTLLFLACVIVIAGLVVSGFTFFYFALPSRRAMASIELPSSVEDTAAAEAETTEEEKSTDTYIADVYKSLTLRESPNSSAKEIAGLPPMTHMEIINYVDNTNYAYVEVTTGESAGYKGYVNTDYITRLGEPTIRANAEE